MENNSASTISPTWPTHWPENAFKAVPTLLLICGSLVAAGIGLALGMLAVILYDPQFRTNLQPHHLTPQGIVDALILQLALELPIGIFLLTLLPWITGTSFRQLGFVRPHAREFGIAIFGAFAAIFAGDLAGSVIEKLTHTHYTQDVVTLFLTLHSPGEIAFFAIFAAVLAPIVEETVFRLFLFNLGLRYLRFLPAAIISALLFGFAHLNGFAHPDLYNAIPLVCVGFIFACVYFFSRNAYMSMISHGLLNASSLLILLLNPHAANL